MAIGALLGVKILRRNAEHVVTLNANAMKNRLSWRRSIVFRAVSLRLRRFVGHERILAYWRASQHHLPGALHGRHPSGTAGASYEAQSEPRRPPPAIRLPHESLLEYQVLIAPALAGRARTE